jgi:hypothetical protein
MELSARDRVCCQELAVRRREFGPVTGDIIATRQGVPDRWFAQGLMPRPVVVRTPAQT